jgi:hypothetical protein
MKVVENKIMPNIRSEKNFLHTTFLFSEERMITEGRRCLASVDRA